MDGGGWKLVGYGGRVKQALEVREVCRLSCLVTAAEVDWGGLMRVGVVHRRESVVQVNRLLALRERGNS